MDHALVARLRAQVAEELREERHHRADTGEVKLSTEDERRLGQSLILSALQEHRAEQLREGIPLPGTEEDAQVADAVHAALFGLGRLQPLIDDQSLSEINVKGCDDVWLIADDGSKRRGEPVANSDEELVEWVRTMATYTGLSSRPWDATNRHLEFRLPDGSRLVGVLGAVERPVISIRLKRRPRVTLTMLRERDTYDEQLQSFLEAAILARQNFMVSGETGAGKALALDTPIPTPQGWTTMGELRAGDEVFSDTGERCCVLLAHEVLHGRDCYAVTFADGEVIVADGEHLWEVTRRVDRVRASKRHPPRRDSLFVTDDELAELEGLARRVQEQPDRQVSVREAVALIGERHGGMVAREARALVPGGRVRQEWELVAPRNSCGSSMVNTYSLQALVKAVFARRATPRKDLRGPERVVLATADMVGQVRPEHRHYNYAVRIAGALDYPTQPQYIDPYVLGIWLGDGTTAAAQITTADPEVVAAVEAAGYPCRLHTPKDPYRYAVKGELQPKLRAAGVLGDKHIPREYLRGDREQRLALLQGLMDSDGYCSTSGQLVFAVNNRVLAEQTLELVRGLGYAPRLTSKPATFRGTRCGTSYLVAWTTHDPMFRLPRKLDRQAANSGGPTTRSIVAIKPVESVPVRCITVNSPSRLYLAGRAGVPTHNTTLLRAMCAAIPPQERLITVEHFLELGLQDRPDMHHDVIAMEEQLPNAEGEGGMSIAELVRISRRLDPDRLIVGESIGGEVVALLDALSQGNDGGMTSIHSRDARSVPARIAQYATREGLSLQGALMLAAGSLDFIVHMSRERVGGQLHRYVSSVVEVLGYDGTQVITSEVFAAGPGELIARPAAALSDRRAALLAKHGYDWAHA